MGWGSARSELPAVFAGGVPGDFLEDAVEVLGVLEAEFVGYEVDGHSGVGEHVFGCVDDFALYVFLRVFACLFFDEVAEVVGGEEYPVGEVEYGGESVCAGVAALEVVVEQGFEAAEYVFV